MCWYVDVVMIVGHDAVLDIPGDVDNLASVEEAGREDGGVEGGSEGGGEGGPSSLRGGVDTVSAGEAAQLPPPPPHPGRHCCCGPCGGAQCGLRGLWATKPRCCAGL